MLEGGTVNWLGGTASIPPQGLQSKEKVVRMITSRARGVDVDNE